jgi:hypothetical protein
MGGLLLWLFGSACTTKGDPKSTFAFSCEDIALRFDPALMEILTFFKRQE